MGIIRSAAAAALASVLCASPALCQIRTDGSLGRAPQSLTGPQFTIPEALGALRGANLFHSFSIFGIHAGESATFTTATPGIANVISRVTRRRGVRHQRDAAARRGRGKPGFFFINPAGVTFGAGASIDVPGAFHVSTADYLKFADGKFYADASASSTLSGAPPEAFGFLGTNRATVELSGGARLNASSAAALQHHGGRHRARQRARIHHRRGHSHRGVGGDSRRGAAFGRAVRGLGRAAHREWRHDRGARRHHGGRRAAVR